MSFAEALRKIKGAGLRADRYINHPVADEPDALDELPERIRKLFEMIAAKPKNAMNMVYFVMYDIENDKVRTQVSKYLERKGCVRMQKSVFLANTSREVYNEIHQTLHEVNDCYENADSIVMVPLSSDEAKSMRLIGQNINLDVVLQSRNTLFF